MEQKKCPFCGEFIDTNAGRCPVCAELLPAEEEPDFCCPYCAEKISKNETVCPVCGEELRKQANNEHKKKSVLPLILTLITAFILALLTAFGYFYYTNNQNAGIGVLIREDNNSIVVADVVPGMSADEEGIVPDDIIIAVNNKPVKDLAQTMKMLKGLNGTTVKVTVLRYYESSQYTYKLKRKPLPAEY